MRFLLLLPAVFGQTKNVSSFSNTEVSVKVNSNWLEKGGYEYELKITPSEDLIKDDQSKFPIFYSKL
jgi:hypothetical protein